VVPLAIAVVFGLASCDRSSGGDGAGESASSTSIPTTNPATTSSALLPYGSRGLSYEIVRQGKAKGFEQPTFDDSGWEVGDAPFATHATSCGIFLSGKTEWQGNHTDLLLRIHFDVHGAPDDLEVGIAVDNDIQAYVNGYCGPAIPPS
jgi:hypothetical protein